MFISDPKDDVNMQRQLKTFYVSSNIILRQFAKCDESVNLETVRNFNNCGYCPCDIGVGPHKNYNNEE